MTNNSLNAAPAPWTLLKSLFLMSTLWNTCPLSLHFTEGRWRQGSSFACPMSHMDVAENRFESSLAADTLLLAALRTALLKTEEVSHVPSPALCSRWREGSSCTHLSFSVLCLYSSFSLLEMPFLSNTVFPSVLVKPHPNSNDTQFKKFF